MKQKHIIFIVFIILNIADCNSIQPKPDGYGWDRCPICEGYGYIINSSNTNRDRIKDSEEREEYNDAIRFFSNDPKILEKAYSDTHNYNSGDSGKRGKKICNRCNGKGWIKLQ